MPLSELVYSDHVAVVLTDVNQPDNPVVECSKAFLRLTGYSRDEVIGRNCRFLAGPGTDPTKQAMIRDALKDRQPIVIELLNYRKDGTPFNNSLMIAPVLGDDGSLTGFLGTQVEVSGEESRFVLSRDEGARSLATQLSTRQRQVLSLLARGQRYKQIAFELGIRERTVKMHRSLMLKSLKVETNAEAVRIAVRARI